MKNIALAILCVGLCFYQVYRRSKLGHEDIDIAAAFFAFIAAIGVFIV